MTLFTLLVILYSIYIVIYLSVSLLMLFKVRIKNGCSNSAGSRFISIIIAGKNEASNIDKLFTALKNQDYPTNKYEIIFVDDNSYDGTFEKVFAYKSKFHSLKVIKAKNKRFPHKKGALDIGISQSSGELLLITDADTQPANKWISEFANHFSSGKDVVIGLTYLKSSGGIANTLARFEHLRNKMLITALGQIGIIFSASASSMGFSKSIFKEADGYKNTLETISGDDDLLLRETIKNNARIGFILCKDALVTTTTIISFKEYLKQKARHISTSNYYLLKHKILLAGWYFSNIAMLLSPFYLFVSDYLIIPFLIKILLDIIIVISKQRDFNYSFGLVQVIFYQILHEVFIVINYFNATFGKITWK